MPDAGITTFGIFIFRQLLASICTAAVEEQIAQVNLEAERLFLFVIIVARYGKRANGSLPNQGFLPHESRCRVFLAVCRSKTRCQQITVRHENMKFSSELHLLRKIDNRHYAESDELVSAVFLQNLRLALRERVIGVCRKQ